MALYWGNKKVSLYLGGKRVKLSIGPSAGLPAGYTQLDYIESTGTQWLDTGYTFDNTTKAHLVFEKTGNNIGAITSGRATAFFGANHNNDGQSCILGWGGTNYVRGSLGHFTATLNTKTDVVVDYTPGNASLIIDGVSYGKGTGTGEIGKSVLLFCVLGNQAAQTVPVTFTQQKIYEFEMWNGDTLVRKLIPAIRNSDDAVGMYDTVSDEFLINSGTGEFVPGYKLPEEYEQVPYLTSTGSQYIDTGISSYKSSYRYVMNVLRNTSSTTFVFAQNPTAGAANIGMFTNSTGYMVQIRNRSTLAANTGIFNNIVLTPTSVSIDGAAKNINSAPEFTINEKLYLFAAGSDSRRFIGAISTFRIYDENGNRILHFVPARRVADGELGMYDVVSKKFFTNQGTGVFTTDDIEAVSEQSTKLSALSMTGTNEDLEQE